MVTPGPSVFVFIGDDFRSKEKAIQDLSSLIFGPSSRELDYKVFYGDEAAFSDVLEYLTTIPFSSEKRLIVIRDFDSLSKPDRLSLAEYARSPSGWACLVLEAKLDSALEGFDGIERYADIRRFDNARNAQVADEIRKFAKENKKDIEEDAVSVLRELVGERPICLNSELEKLVSYVGERRVIKIRDVEAIVGRSLAHEAFELTGAIGDRNLDEAMRIVSDSVTMGKKSYEIIGMLCWHLKRLLRAKALQGKGLSGQDIAGALGIPRRYADGFLIQLGRFTMPQIKSKLEMLLEADLDIKRTRYDPALVLEFSIIKLCLD